MLEMLSNCTLCPRNCKVNRNNGEKGFCGAGEKVKIARAALHYWEEPCISGSRGSGTVFFSYCNLQCVYCQNYEISQLNQGQEITIERLSEIFLELQNEGAHNINLVTPTHYVPQIIEALKLASMKGLHIPIVYNSSGYENAETIKMLNGFIDIYLTDLKYFETKYSSRYSKASDYFCFAKTAIDEMVRQIGVPIFDSEGIMKKGVIVRHLMLPGLLFDSKKILDFLFETYENDIYISIMNQYTPLKNVEEYPEINKKINQKHYKAIIKYAQDLGIENGFIQEGETAKESFIPSFDGKGV